MYTLIMVLTIWNGNATYGGPIVKDGFKSEVACLAYAEKIKKAVLPRYPRGALNVDTSNSFAQISCIKMD